MPALAGRALLDRRHDRLPGLGLILKLPMPHEFVLQRTEAAFHGRVVVAVARTTHAGDGPAPGPHHLVACGPILVCLDHDDARAPGRGDSLAATDAACSCEQVPPLPCAVGFPRLLMEHAPPCDEGLIGVHTGTLWPTLPGLEAASAHL